MEPSKQNLIHLQFNEELIFKFNILNLGLPLAVSTNPHVKDGPLFVDLLILNNFINLHINFWNSNPIANNEMISNQLKVIQKIKENLKILYIIAIKNDLLVKNIVNLRQLLTIFNTSISENYSTIHNTNDLFGMLDIEEHALIKAMADYEANMYCRDIITEIINISKYMAKKLYKMHIP